MWTISINVHHKVVLLGYMYVLLSFICSQIVQLQCIFMLSYVITRRVCLLTTQFTFSSCCVIKAACSVLILSEKLIDGNYVSFLLLGFKQLFYC